MKENNMTIEILINSHPDLVSQIEARAREGHFTRAALDAAVSAGRDGMIPLAEADHRVTLATAKAIEDGTAAERGRIMNIHATCKGCKTETMFPRLVADGCNEQQACDRIQDALAMQSDDQEIVSRIGGGAYGKKQLGSGGDIYAARQGQHGGKP
jgi:hypothetical protein